MNIKFFTHHVLFEEPLKKTFIKICSCHFFIQRVYHLIKIENFILIKSIGFGNCEDCLPMREQFISQNTCDKKISKFKSLNTQILVYPLF